ncbi:MAG: Uma2 family endonuclease [Caloramator sp.]|nr:Uma2 family endonuclease [Caloramator sp.]
MLPSPKKYSYEEFLSLTKDKRAEFIDGEIYLLASPSFEHQMVISKLNIELMNYFKNTDCIPILSPFDVIFENGSTGEINVVQPDLTIICDKENITDKGYKGVPKLIIEVLSPSTASIDYIKKMSLYAKFNVEEYWIINPRNKTLQIFILERDLYIEHAALTSEDIVNSYSFKGLSIKLKDIFNW